MHMELLYYALYLGLSFISFQVIVFIRNTHQLTNLPKPNSSPRYSYSVLIPARNEEKSITHCLASVVNQTYSNYEIIILDDRSTDHTLSILNSFKNDHPTLNVKIIQGEQKPDHWLGKNWACHQLSKQATGQVLVFIDADTRLEPTFLGSVDTAISTYRLDALTVWPFQILGSFWEKVIIPHMYFVIYTLLPIKYTHSDPKWMPNQLIPRFRSSFAAACGQCMIFTKNCYAVIGGHETVKDQVVEDVQLARLIRANNFNFRMFHGNDSFSCRMYSSEAEIFQGFRKNFLAGFGYNIPLFLLSWFLHASAYVLPWVTLFIGLLMNKGLMIVLSISMILLPILIRYHMDEKNRWQRPFGVLHVLGVLWFNRLALIVLLDKLTGKKVNWKNRSV